MGVKGQDTQHKHDNRGHEAPSTVGAYEAAGDGRWGWVGGRDGGDGAQNIGSRIKDSLFLKRDAKKQKAQTCKTRKRLLKRKSSKILEGRNTKSSEMA